MLLQRLSEYFGVSKSVFRRKGIFDAIIGVDSGFYLDPTLLKNTRIPEFKGAYAKVEEHYKKAFSLLKFASANHNLKAWNQAIRLCALQDIAESLAESQALQGYQFFKVFDDNQLEYVVLVKGESEDVYMLGKIIAFQIQGL